MIQFVHVGKCAGSSIRCALDELDINCKEFHCNDANVALSSQLKANTSSYYLVSVRDPIKRFISAFYWDYYEKRILNDLYGPNDFWKKIYEVFTSPNELAESLTSQDFFLKEMAQNYIYNSHLHAHYTLSWYFSVDNVKFLNNENCHVVRTERADEDFLTFLKKIGANSSIFNGLAREKQDYKHSINNYNIALSELGKHNLENAYFEDYIILDGFFRKGLIDKRY